jgi:hypothetical protein
LSLLIKKGVFKDKSNIYALLTSIISVIAGIIGYNISFLQNIELAPLYIYSLSISFLFQIISSSVLNYKKNTILSKFKYEFDIRNSIMQFLFLNIIIVLGCYVGLKFFVSGIVNDFTLLIFMQLVFSYLQVISFNNSMYYQLKNIEVFLKINFYASVIRAIIIFSILFYFELSFWSLVLANVFSALSICMLYGIKLKCIITNYRLGLNKISLVRSIFKLEGYLRSYRMYSEPWIMTLVISFLNVFKILIPSEMDVLNFAMPYLNSISSQFRQLFIKFERAAYLGELNLRKLCFTYITLIPFLVIVVLKDYILSWVDTYNMNSIVLIFNNYFLALIGLLLLILPLTLGYSYVDYSKKHKYYNFLFKTTLTFLVLFVVTILGYKMFDFKFVFIFIPLLYPISIAFHKKKLVE